MIPDLPALSIKQPWAWAILHAGKDIENRNWPTRFRGRFLIHASKGCTPDEYLDACAFMAGFCGGVAVPPLESLPRGGIVGVASLGACVDESDSDWFVGEWGFELNDVHELEFTPCRGMLGFFKPQIGPSKAPEADLFGAGRVDA
jgi:hypothetical protein